MEVDCKVARRQRKHGEVTVYKPKGEKHWYYRVLIHGKRRNRTTHHTDKKLALMQAKIIAKSLLTGGDARETMARPGYASVGDVCRVWLQMSEASTKRNNVSTLRKWVRSFAGGDADAVAMTRCTAGELRIYLRAWPGSPEGRKSTARQILAMFQPLAMDWYRDARLVMPEVAELRKVRVETKDDEEEFEGFTLIPAPVLREMDAAAERLRTSADLEERRVWAVYALMRWCGLRNIEVAALRWSWIKRGAKHWEIRVLEYSYADGTKFAPKKSAGVVPIRRRVLGQLLRALGRDGEFVIPRGNPTEAKILTSRTINGFMRPFFPEAGPKEKKAYLLRKQSGSEVAQKYGLTAMATFLRQKGIKTAWDNYHAQLQPLSPL
jgi:integrase